jgi:hypothetical protein
MIKGIEGKKGTPEKKREGKMMKIRENDDDTILDIE